MPENRLHERTLGRCPVSATGPRAASCKRLANLGAEEQCRHPTGGLFLEGGDDVAVGVEGDPDVAVAEAFAYDLGMHVRLERERGVGVTQIVESSRAAQRSRPGT